MQRMPPFEAEVPDPLRQNEPKLLAPGGVRTPAVRILFLILIREHRLKSPAMQVQCHHISRSKRIHRQGREEQLVDDLTTRRADGRSGSGRRMRRDDHPCARSCRSQKQIRAVKERATRSRFGMGGLLVWWLGQAGLHLRKIEEIIVLASHDVGQASQICDNGTIAILAIQSRHGLAKLHRLRFHIRADRLHGLPEFSAIFTVARSRGPGEGAHPLVRVCLENGRARPDHFAPLAPQIARSADLVQPTLGGWEIRCARQGSLAGGLSRPINIEHQVVCSLPVPQPTCFLLLLHRSCQEIFEKHRAQRLNRSLIQSGKKATQCRASGQAIPSEQRHERVGKRLQALVERFQRAFAADGIAQQHSHKVDELIASEAPTRKAHAFFNEREHTLVPQIVSYERHFAQPAWRRGNGLGRGLDCDRGIGDTTQRSSLHYGNGSFFPCKEAHFYACSLLARISLRISWVWQVQATAPARCVLTIKGHTDRVLGLAFAPDGSTLASGSWDRTVKLWEVASGRLLQTLSGHRDKVHCVAWSPDGRTVASGSVDKTIWLYDVVQGHSQVALRGHSAAVYSLAFTSDSASLLSGGEDGTLRVWDVASRQCVRVMQGYAIGIYEIDWSPDGMRLVSGGTDTLVTIWDVTTGAASKVLRGHNWIVYGVAWSPDGRFVASCELHTLIRLWDATSGTCVQTLQDLAASPLDVAWSPDGQLLAWGTDQHGIQVWDMTKQDLLWDKRPFSTIIHYVAWSPDGTRVVGGGDDGSLYLWGIADGM